MEKELNIDKSTTKKGNSKNTAKKKTKSKKEERSLYEKIQDFVRYNWFTMSVLYLAGGIFTVYAWYTIMDKQEETNKLIKQHIQSVVLMTPDGRAVSVTRTKIDPDTEGFKEHIKRTMVDYLIIDNANITKGLTVNVRNENDIYNNSEKIKFFAKNYLAKKPESINMFKSYMTYLLSQVNRDELPEYIQTWGSEIKEFKNFPDGRFEIKIKIYFQINAFYIEENKYKEKDGEAVISARGYFNLKEADENNALGLKFEKITLPKIEKRENRKAVEN